MPIQITELNISVSVNQPGPSTAVPASTPQSQQHERSDLLDECVDQVMKIIQDKKER
jgi:hypothetical protein|nr:DUF5908 family protein [uncultured Mucilaginibacter sp.]